MFWYGHYERLECYVFKKRTLFVDFYLKAESFFYEAQFYIDIIHFYFGWYFTAVVRTKERTHSSWRYLMKCSWFSRFRDGTRLDTVNTTPARGALIAFHATSNSDKTTRPITLLARLIRGCPRLCSSNKLMICKYKNTNKFKFTLETKNNNFF